MAKKRLSEAEFYNQVKGEPKFADATDDQIYFEVMARVHQQELESRTEGIYPVFMGTIIPRLNRIEALLLAALNAPKPPDPQE